MLVQSKVITFGKTIHPLGAFESIEITYFSCTNPEYTYSELMDQMIVLQRGRNSRAIFAKIYLFDIFCFEVSRNSEKNW